MKTPFTLFAALICAQLHATEPTLPFQDLLDHAHYTDVIQQAAAAPEAKANPRWIESQATAMYRLGQHQPVETLLSEAMGHWPDDAGLHHIAALNKFSLAQQASIFSAPGLAKEGRDLLKKAVELSPDNPKLVVDLIGFYTQAPGIAGGDKAAARALLPSLKQQAPSLSVLAESMVLLADDEPQAALRLIDAQLSQTHADSRLWAQKASILASQEQAALAFDCYQQAALAAETAPAKYSYFYQMGRLSVQHRLDPAKGQQALTQFIQFYAGSEQPQLPWAKLRLAQLFEQQQDHAQAAHWLAQANAMSTRDDKFLDEAKKLEKQLKKRKS